MKLEEISQDFFSTKTKEKYEFQHQLIMNQYDGPNESVDNL